MGAMQLKVKRVSVNGDTALVVADWVIDGLWGASGHRRRGPAPHHLELLNAA
jgi:hypothetical protein